MLARNLHPFNVASSITIAILTLFSVGCSTTPEETEPMVMPQTDPQPSTEEIQEPPVSQTRDEPVIEIKPTAPQRYVVVKGDTLWDISRKFLDKPWYWPEIWHVNPQIENPHLIYPGDVISVIYVGGKPYLQVSGGPRVTDSSRQFQQLSPKIRIEDLGKKDNALPVQAIRQFIIRPRVVSEEELSRAPYLVGSQDDRLIYGNDDIVYVRNLLESTPNNLYNVFRPGRPLRDPHTDEILGYEAILVGDARVMREGDPATVQLTRTEREALLGDRLLPYDSTDEDRTYYPHAPSDPVEGSIISLFDAISQIGQYQIAVLNLGARNGMEKGHVLAALRAGRTVRDPFTNNSLRRSVTLPDERSGIMMVFRVFEKVSYALVMDAQRPILLGDAVRNP